MSKNQPFRTFETTKKLNLDRYGPLLLKATAAKRDKIEPICSPKMYKNHPDYTGARVQRDR